jgi:hypothetical protein
MAAALVKRASAAAILLRDKRTVARENLDSLLIRH